MAAVKKNYVVETIRKGQMIELLTKGNRLDGRALDQYRPLSIQTGFIQKANGSAMVSLGNTQVLAGVKVATGTPFPDTPDKGLLVVNAEVLPLSSAYAEAGPPSEDASSLREWLTGESGSRRWLTSQPSASPRGRVSTQSSST